MEIRFLLSENLGRLAKWLRMLGYDAAVPRSISLQTKIDRCRKERRIFLTRSKRIIKNPQKFKRRMIISDKHFAQLKELRGLIEYDEELIFSRCIECNRILFPIAKNKIAENLDQNILDRFADFKICRKCGRIFWQGSHYHDMKNKLKRIIDK